MSDRDNDAIRDAQGPASHVLVPLGDRIERARINGHHRMNSCHVFALTMEMSVSPYRR